MLKLDNNLLDELGLGALPEDQKRQMLQHIYETLELRVGTQLANQMTDRQLEEFEKFIDAGGDANQAQALQWLETNLPNYKQVVQETFDALKVEIKSMAPQLLAAAQQQQGGGQYAAPAQPVQQPYAQPQPTYPQPAQAQPQPQPMQPQQPAFDGQAPQPWQPPQPAAVQPDPQYAAPAQPVQQPYAQPQPTYPQPAQAQPQPQPMQPQQPAFDGQAPQPWQPPQPPLTPPSA